ncbi:MAG: hypothetical protein ACKOFE_07395, partial [Bacteroidota bacterium]
PSGRLPAATICEPKDPSIAGLGPRPTTRPPDEDPFRKWWLRGAYRWELSMQLTNVFNQANAIIPNPVTGRAWEPGDPVPSSWRDPAFLDPRDARSRGLPPDNPARYMAPRHFMLGIALKYR